MSTPIAKEHEIISSRIVAFPIDLVYKAWTDPNHLKNWWGPAGFTNTFHVHELKPGGRWTFTMHGPEKGNYENDCEFLRIEPPHFLSWKRYSQPLFEVEVTFTELSPNQTEFVFRMIFPTVRDSDKVRPFAVEKNEENFDKLEEELKKMMPN